MGVKQFWVPSGSEKILVSNGCKKLLGVKWV